VEAHPCLHGLDEVRAAESGRLDATGTVYLDYTGGSLYAESLVDEHMRMLRDGVYGSPHSINPTSSASTAMVQRRASCGAPLLPCARGSPRQRRRSQPLPYPAQSNFSGGT